MNKSDHWVTMLRPALYSGASIVRAWKGGGGCERLPDSRVSVKLAKCNEEGDSKEHKVH